MADPLAAARAALADRPAWLVGGAIRDRALGRETIDLDVVVDGDPAAAARAIATAIAAASLLASLPPILIVVAFQRYLVRGLLAGALRE